MLLQLLFNGEIVVFAMILVAIILSLSFHEFGHAWSAKMYGDDTAERLGRLTVNPVSHIDPMGLLMVVLIGIGYAKPVPFDPRNFKSVWGVAGTALAGPAANLLIAFMCINFQIIAFKAGWSLFLQPGAFQFFNILITINLILMLFNLIPLGILDGHHILPYFLPKTLAQKYRTLNAQYGMYVLLGLLMLSVLGVPVLSFILLAADKIRVFLEVIPLQ